MNTTVIIDCDSQGNYSVGQEPSESDQQEAAEQQGGGGDADDQGIQMQPAKSIDDALKMARALLEQSAQGGDGDGEQPDQDNGNAAFEQGYSQTAGPSMGGGQ